MIPVKRILFVKRIFSCCHVLQAHALNNQFLRYYYAQNLGGGGAQGVRAPPCQTEIYTQQYAKWCLLDGYKVPLAYQVYMMQAFEH